MNTPAETPADKTDVISVKVFADQAIQLAAIAKKMNRLSPETRALIASADQLVTTCTAIQIGTAENCRIAGDQLTKLKGVQKDVEAMRRSMVDPINAAVRGINDWFHPYTDRLAAAESLIKKGILAFNAEQEKQRQIAEARRQEAADRAATELQKRAENHAKAGHEHIANVLEQQAATVMATPVATTAPIKIKGLSTRTTYSAEVIDLKALAGAVAAGTVPPSCIKPNQAELNKLAQSWKLDLVCPGVVVRQGASIGAKSA